MGEKFQYGHEHPVSRALNHQVTCVDSTNWALISLCFYHSVSPHLWPAQPVQLSSPTAVCRTGAWKSSGCCRLYVCRHVAEPGLRAVFHTPYSRFPELVSVFVTQPWEWSLLPGEPVLGGLGSVLPAFHKKRESRGKSTAMLEYLRKP